MSDDAFKAVEADITTLLFDGPGQQTEKRLLD